MEYIIKIGRQLRSRTKFSEKVRQKAKTVSIWPFRTADRKIHQLDWNLNKILAKKDNYRKSILKEAYFLENTRKKLA